MSISSGKINKYNHLLAEILMASYLYYYEDETVMLDEEYDSKYLEMKANADSITHKYKSLVDFTLDMTSLYYLKQTEYPQGLIRCALKWLSVHKG